MKVENLTINPQRRIMPTENGVSALGGNQINNS